MIRPALFTLALVACSSPPGLAGIDAPPPAIDATDAAPDAPTCGLRGGIRGKTSRTIMADGLTRTYQLYLPASDPRTPIPLVFVHHGYTMSGQQMFDITGYKQLANDEKIAVVFPDGQASRLANGAP